MDNLPPWAYKGPDEARSGGDAMHLHRRRFLAAVGLVVTVLGSSAAVAVAAADAARRPKASVEIADTGTLAPDGLAVTVDVTASCARGWQVLEAFITVSQPQASGMAGLPLTCTGRAQAFTVTVQTLDLAFQPGEAQASALVLIERRGRTAQAQDTEVILLA
jgi:hypothetical protein